MKLMKDIIDMDEYLGLSKDAGEKLFWKTLKEYYQSLTDDEEKNKILAMIFKDTKKEG